MIKFCQKCYEEHRAFSPSGYYAFLKENVSHCILNDCGGELQDIDFPAQDLADIMNVSESKEFIDAMIHLRQENIIEYELKMSQIRTINQSAKQHNQSQSNLPHCPTCGSTNISKIGSMERVGSVAIWGLFSKKINKTFKCNSCGHTW